MILVIGGGLAGLSAAYNLQEKNVDYQLLEAEKYLGGLCRSVRVGGYTFDYSGHLLCLRNTKVLQWVSELLEGRLTSLERRACIYTNESWIPYPFQAHIGALPDPIMKECLGEFILKAVKEANTSSYGPETLEVWLTNAFGDGICKYFFRPYNEKLFGVPLAELAHHGLEWSIPKPSLQEVIDGALGKENPGMGYNPVFHYPTDGGIERLPQALAARLTRARSSCSVQGIDWRRRLAFLSTGEVIAYDKIISTAPLPHLLGSLEPALPEVKRKAFSLRWVPVWVLNVGVGRENISDQHWMYFPEQEFPFFRVGCYTAFGPHLAPRGCSSLYVEVAGHTANKLGEERWIQETLRGLVRCGILRCESEVEVLHPILLPWAYVIHDRARLENLPDLLELLQEHGIYSIGRYGSWGYGTMEEAILQGRDAAAKVVG